MAEMIFKGKNLHCKTLQDNILELVIDHGSASVNKLDSETLGELDQAFTAIAAHRGTAGLLITSAKSTFVVGADITEFPSFIRTEEGKLNTWLKNTHRMLNTFEDLPFPSVVAIGGICLGGGFELALAATYRIASTKAKIGLPETKLGIFPGWGGTIRLPRLCGADNAIEWIAQGSTNSPEDALKIGAVEAVVAPEHLHASALAYLKRAAVGELNWRARVEQKKAPLKLLSPVEHAMVFETAKGFVAGQAGPHYPAPVRAIQVMQDCAAKTRDASVEIEIKGFIEMMKTQAASSLVGIFLADQFNKKKIKNHIDRVKNPVKRAAVVGAGIMGGGIAYQTASSGIPILMKDIADKALEAGMNEASKLLQKQIERKKLTVDGLGKTLGMITPTLSLGGDFAKVDMVVEAIVENEGVKKKVLAEIESTLGANAILASNTSTISITQLAKALKHPDRFCGIHFFNPVHRMPLVEIIRGKETSDDTISRAVAFASALGKTPIVVQDCAGFLVNRVLFPYLFGLLHLVQDGVDFKRVDKVMERFGWPMGPAYLIDVIGIDTCVHAGSVMAAAFPDRMGVAAKNGLAVLNGENRLGQKNGKGFYSYTVDKKGKPKKDSDPAVYKLLPALKEGKVTDEEIIDRMMIPLINECARCLDERIVETPMELDLALINGVGFPPFLGGAMRYVDTMGIAKFVARTAPYRDIHPSYRVPASLEERAKKNTNFYPKEV